MFFVYRNLFKQSYAMPFHCVMEPVLGGLGVQLISHNFGKGGIGTSQDAMGLGSYMAQGD